MKLKDALELYWKEDRVPSNVYGWYRKCAANNGNMPIGIQDVSVYKEGNDWHVDEKELNAAILKHREHVALIKKNTSDYDKGIIHGKDGESIETNWGRYRHKGGFRLVSSDYAQLKNGSTGTWYCNKCNKPASTEHNKEECHLCSDWNSCGGDCTLSKVYCEKCETEIII
ncbi:MAG: hypothetical protein V1729_03260 [Candidatus Woesearchaeota archaeon]